MADPLAELADRQVPERTNYFDPAASQSMVSRYANARRNYETSGVLAKAQDDQSRRQFEQARTERQQVLWDRDDEEYQAKKEALANQGEYMLAVGNLDHEDPQYQANLAEILAGTPPQLLEEPGMKAILTFKDRAADDARRRRDADAARQQTQAYQTDRFERSEVLKAAAQGASPEMRAKYTDANGNLDLEGLRYEAGVAAQAKKMAEFDRRQGLLQQNRLQLVNERDLSRRGRERRGKVASFIVEDRQAFPRQLDTLAKRYQETEGKAPSNIENLKSLPKWGAAYAQAEAWDKKPLDNELSAAFAYNDADDYVNLVPGLSDSQKERRRQVWEHAHSDEAVEERPAGQVIAEVPNSNEVPKVRKWNPATKKLE